jgi:hypothetical protein
MIVCSDKQFVDNWCLFVDNYLSLWTIMDKWIICTHEAPPYMGGSF